MKKVNKIFLIDDDSIANFVNQHLIKGLKLADELKVIHSIQQAKREVYSLIEQLNGECMAEFVILLNTQLDLQKQLLPSYLISNLPVLENDSLLIILITYNRLNDPALIFHIGGVLPKPVTRENLRAAWQKIF
jgi:hypothetical protein